MPRLEPTFHCDLARRLLAARAVILYPIAALTRQMTVATYPAPIADLRGVRLLEASFFTARRVITRPRADHHRSRSGLGQGRYDLRLAVDWLCPARERWQNDSMRITPPERKDNTIQWS